ncbi:MAG: hypothetical protein LBU73_07755 [Helicobacteraceae bacterium]|jgi:hypothetical protein|nr:hypothetical protein [Helicobacteraceae bacterium]
MRILFALALFCAAVFAGNLDCKNRVRYLPAISFCPPANWETIGDEAIRELMDEAKKTSDETDKELYKKADRQMNRRGLSKVVFALPHGEDSLASAFALLTGPAPLSLDDFAQLNIASLQKTLGGKLTILGDDTLVSKPTAIKRFRLKVELQGEIIAQTVYILKPSAKTGALATCAYEPKRQKEIEAICDDVMRSVEIKQDN